MTRCLMQATSDIFLGWTRNQSNDNCYYWRQLKDWTGSVNVERVGYTELRSMATLRGWTLARAHARSGDAIAISSYLEEGQVFDKAIAEFSAQYADQNDRDYRAYLTEIREGRLEISAEE